MPLSSRVAVNDRVTLPDTVDNILEATVDDLFKLDKSQLIEVLMSLKKKVLYYMDEKATAVEKVRGKLFEYVDELMDTLPIRYSDNKKSKFQPDAVRRVLRCLTVGNDKMTASRLAGIDRNTLASWCKDNPDGMGAAVESAMGACDAIGDEAILRLLVGGEERQVQYRYNKDGDTIGKIVQRTTPDPRVAIAVKAKFKKVVEHTGTVEHRVLTPEREKKLRALGYDAVKEEIESQPPGGNDV